MSRSLKSFDLNEDVFFEENNADKEMNFLILNLAPNYPTNFIFNQIFDDFNQMENSIPENTTKNEEAKSISGENLSIGFESSCSNENSDSAINLSEIEAKEQINEVKYFFFMVLFNECEYSDEYKGFKIFKKNELNLIRIVKQKVTLNEITKKFVLGEKIFAFLPRTQKKFQFEDENINKTYDITLDKGKIQITKDEKDLLTAKEFEEKYKIKIEAKKDGNILDSFSEEEMNNKLYYDMIGNNEFIRFSILLGYRKEIDAIFTKHKEINLASGIVDFTDGISNFIEGKNSNIQNDLKSIIIFKNFKETVIPKDKPIVMEIKKSCRLSDLIIQLKQDAKIFKYIKCHDSKIELPKYFIGIICQYEMDTANKELSKLYKPYKDSKISNLSHILNVIKKMEINIIIGIIKDEKIMDYPLGKCDYDCDIPNVFRRVDLNYLNKKLCRGKYTEEKIDEIILKYGTIYKSIKIEKAIPYRIYKQDIDKMGNVIAEKEIEIASLANVNQNTNEKAKDELIKVLYQEVSKKDNVITEKEIEIASKDNVIAEKEIEIESKDNVITEKENLIEQLKQELKKYKQSENP